METLHHERLANEGLRHDKIVNIEIMVVFSIRNRTLQALTRSMRETAFASVSASARGVAALPIGYFLFAFLSAV